MTYKVRGNEMVPFGLNLDRDEGSSQWMKTWRKRLQTEGTAHADPQDGYSQALRAAFFPCSFFFIFEFTYFNRGLLYPTSWEVYLSLPTWRKTISLKRSGPYVASSVSQVLNPWSPGSFLGGGHILFWWKRKALLHEKEEDPRTEADACSLWGSDQVTIMPWLGIKGKSRRKGQVSGLSPQSRITPHPFLPSLSSRSPNSDSWT